MSRKFTKGDSRYHLLTSKNRTEQA